MAAAYPIDKLLKSKEHLTHSGRGGGHPAGQSLNAMVSLPSSFPEVDEAGSVVLVPMALHSSRFPLSSVLVTAVPNTSRLSQLK